MTFHATSAPCHAPFAPRPMAWGLTAHSRARAVDFMAAELRGGEGLQIGYSTDSHMAPGTVHTHREVLTAELDPTIRTRLATFGGDLREALTSGMALKLIAGLPAPVTQALADYILAHRHDDRGRFRFYAPERSIAPCADMTGICLVGLWRAGRISAELLRSGALEILRGAAAESLRPEQNISHGGSNGSLDEGVLKIYWDDHPDDRMRRRGRKHDAVVVCDGLHAVLLAAREAGFAVEGAVPLFEYRADGSVAHNTLPADEIVRRSVGWLRDACMSGSLLEGTTYYGCSTFLMALLADLLADGGPWTASLRGPLHEALSQWSHRRNNGRAARCERSALALAGALFAARRSEFKGAESESWARELVRLQQPDGSWPAAPWYRMRTRPLFYGNTTSTTVMAVAALSVR